MQIRDPVCGMSFDREEAVAVVEQAGEDYRFCSPGCAEAFAQDPDRFIEIQESLPVDQPLSDRFRGRLDDPDEIGATEPLSTTCPICGVETGVARVCQTELGSLGLVELETMVRNEWRRRMGSEAYRRPHPRSLIRSLVVYALAPESLARRMTAENEVWSEVAMLESWGLSRQAMRAELQELMQATLDVLADNCAEVDESRAILDPIERMLEETLSWPPA